MDDEVFSEDGGSDSVRLAVMKTLTKMAGEVGKEATSGIDRSKPKVFLSERALQIPSFRCDISCNVQATPTSFRRQLLRGSGRHGRVLPLCESDAELLVSVRRLGSLLRYPGE